MWLQVYRSFLEAVDAIDNGERQPVGLLFLNPGSGLFSSAMAGGSLRLRRLVAHARRLKQMGSSPAHPPIRLVIGIRLFKSAAWAIQTLIAGVNQWDSDAPPKYVNNTHLSARVGRLNPDWNEDASGVWGSWG